MDGQFNSVNPGKTLGIVSLILGILAILLGATGLGIVPGIVAVVLGVISAKKSGEVNAPRGLSIAGIITGAVSLPLGITCAVCHLCNCLQAGASGCLTCGTMCAEMAYYF
jgi:hypothetical protein